MSEIPEFIDRHRRSLASYLERELERGPYDFISDGLRYHFGTGGKLLRPALCLATCEALGGDPRTALPFATASEVLHNFFLVHDDLEDGDEIRRDQPALWKKLGPANAINIGDFMVAWAYDLIVGDRPELESISMASRLAFARSFTFAFHKTVEGQALDINLRGSPEVDLATYHRLVTCKTGYYLALPWIGGALAAGVEPAAAEALWEIGRSLGPAFQIRDDVIDLTVGKGRGGEVGCDVREGKPSILYAWVLENRRGTDDERRRLVEIVRAPREETLEGDVRWVIDLYERLGALKVATEEADRLATRCEETLETLPFDEKGKAGFREIVRFVVDRST